MAWDYLAAEAIPVRLWYTPADNGSLLYGESTGSRIETEWSMDRAWIAYSANESEGDTNLLSSKGAHLLSRNGEHRIISDFNQHSEQFFTDGYRWSADSSMLAFVGHFSSPDGMNTDVRVLYLYNIRDGHYVYQCPIYQKTQSDPSTPDIFWSPDNRMLVLSNLGSGVLVYDLQKRLVYQLAESGAVLGWLVDELPAR